jgi:hypothetical protein
VLSVTDFPIPIPEFDSCYSHQLLQADAVPYVMHREQSLKYTSLIWTLTHCPIGIWIREVPLGFEMGLIQGNRLGITTLIWEETAHRDGSILSFWACTIQTCIGCSGWCQGKTLLSFRTLDGYH